VGVSVVEDSQRPAPAGEFTGDRRVGDHGTFLALIEPRPPGVQASIRGLSPRPRRRRRRLPAPPQITSRPIRRPMMPGCLDQQPAAWLLPVLVTRPGSGSIQRSTRGHQAQIGADRPAAQSFPIPDLGSQPERRQRRDPRRQPSRPTTGVNTESAAIAVIAWSRRPRRSRVASIASKAAS